MKRKCTKRLLALLMTVSMVLSLTLTASASVGGYLMVSDINIKVNDQVFKPTDVTGKAVKVFEYNGTTYAPLRALAEAYGLKVGYSDSLRCAYVYEETIPDLSGVTAGDAMSIPNEWSSGTQKIWVDPINIVVNGKIFKPTDVTGKRVPVFEYAGTTYAPLRALAEAYGLQVGYDAESRLAYVYDPEPAHVFDSGVVVKEATCSIAGTKLFTCSDCGETKTETISATGHFYDSGVVNKYASCTSYGSVTYTCAVCGDTKTEVIPMKEHTANDDFLCIFCGTQMPISLTMTDAERQTASKVHWMKSFYEYNSSSKCHEIYLRFQDTNQTTTLNAPAVVSIRIVDDAGNVLYSAKKLVSSSDFTETTTTGTGFACVTIKDSELTPGTTKYGTVYWSVTNNGYFDFTEKASNAYYLPIKTATVILPSLPTYIDDYTYSGKIDSSVKITDITVEAYYDDGLLLYFTGEKTYDRQGSGYSQSCKVGWKLYDREGYVVDSGVLYTDAMKVGDRFRNQKDYIWDGIDPNETYTLVLVDVD